VPVAIGRCGIQIVLADSRSKGKAAEYYPALGGGDDRRDAFRHIFASVILRRYCTEWGALLVTNANEWLANNSYAAHQMDYHNNTVGRVAKYNHFRGHWFWDRWGWKTWGQRVRSYIDAPGGTSGTFANGVYFQAWANGAPNSQVDSELNLVEGWKYVYFQ